MKIQSSIQSKLQHSFAPSHLEVINESHMHSVPENSESHFRVVIVSDKFLNSAMVERHRLVYQALSKELQGGVHALAIVAKTNSEWNQKQDPGQSPICSRK
jgi:BolA protein